MYKDMNKRDLVSPQQLRPGAASNPPFAFETGDIAGSSSVLPLSKLLVQNKWADRQLFRGADEPGGVAGKIGVAEEVGLLALGGDENLTAP